MIYLKSSSYFILLLSQRDENMIGGRSILKNAEHLRLRCDAISSFWYLTNFRCKTSKNIFRSM